MDCQREVGVYFEGNIFVTTKVKPMRYVELSKKITNKQLYKKLLPKNVQKMYKQLHEISRRIVVSKQARVETTDLDRRLSKTNK